MLSRYLDVREDRADTMLMLDCSGCRLLHFCSR